MDLRTDAAPRVEADELERHYPPPPVQVTFTPKAVLVWMAIGRTVDLLPFAVLVSLVIGAELAGILGALAAIPVGGPIAVVAREVASWRRESSLELPPSVDHLRRTEPT